MKKIFSIMLLFALFLPLALAQNSCIDNAEKNSSVLYFFYGDGCPHCAAAEPFLDEMKEKYNFTMISHETWHNETNEKEFESFLVAYKVPKSSWGVPAFFMGSRHIIGFDNKDSIGKNLEEMIQDCLSDNCERESGVIRFSLFGKNIEISKNVPLVFLGAILGFADGFNPCTFSILLFLMSYLFTISASKKKILKLGIIFSSVIFLVYTAIMLGLINIISVVGFRGIGRTIIIGVLILIGLINVKDFFWKGKGISLEIPKFARPILEKYSQKATVPAVIVLALILSFVELGCTLGLPLAYAGILAGKGIFGVSSFLYVLWYNIFYILPLITVILLIYFFVLETDKAEMYRQRFRKWMKLIGGLLMLILALLMILGKL